MDKLSKAQEKPELLGQTMVGYLTWIAPKLNELPLELSRQFIKLRDSLRREHTHGRTVEAVSWLILAYKMFLDYAQYSKAVSDEEAKNMLIESNAIYEELIEKSNESAQDNRPELIFLSTLASMFATGEYMLDSLNSQFSLRDIKTHSKLIGYKDESYYYLIPIAAYSAVCREIRNLGCIFNVSESILLQLLDNEGILKSVNESEKGKIRHRRSIKIKVGNKRPRLIAIDINKMRDILEKYE